MIRRILKGLLLGWAIGLAGGLLGLSHYGALFERSVGLDWLFNLRGPVAAPTGVAVIAIDSLTGSRLDIPDLPREWPRSIHGELVDKLVDLGAAAIVFDVDFRKPRSAAEEKKFADAVARSRRVILFQHLTGKRQPLEDSSGKIRGSVWIEELVSPVEVLAQAARGLGPFPLPKLEAAVYEFWVFKSSAREAPTIPAVGFQLHALEVYDRFYRLLEDSGISAEVELPDSAARITTADELRQLMTAIRGAVTEHPALADNLRLALARARLAGADDDTRRLLASLVAMYLGQNERYLNFYGPPGTIRTVPYHAVIKGPDANTSAAALDLSGQIVFVGFSDLYDPGQPDRFYTVFTDANSIDLSGVEIAATAAANLLHDQSLRIPDLLTTLAILFTFGLAITLLVYLAPASIGVAASIAAAIAYAAFAQMAFNQNQLWLPLATPLLVQFPLALFSGLLAQYLQQRHRVKHISEAIRLYVPEDVSRALADSEIKPETIDQVSYSTCLATDMQGFSSYAEHMRPGELAEFLNDYFDTLARPLSEHDASVTEFRADAIMCAWTGDESDIEIRRKPILASLQAAAAIEEFKDRHDAFEANLRIGLESGEVYVGHSGGGGHFVYSIVGDCANTASRIEGLNKQLHTRILASESTVRGIENLQLRPLGQFVFVGKTEALPVFEILGLACDATAEQRELCDSFAHAIETFTSRNWKQASKEFKSIRKRFPHDGPCLYYLAQCQQRLAADAQDDGSAVIRLTSK